LLSSRNRYFQSPKSVLYRFQQQLIHFREWILERLEKVSVRPVVIIFLILVFAGIVLMQNSKFIRQNEVTGDEPEYIMLCRSIIDDRDFNLEIDQATGVCSEFMSGRFQLRGKSIRPPGLPVFLVPAYLAGRYLPWPGLPFALYLWMGLLYVWLSAEFFLLIQAASNRPRLAWLTTMVAFLLPPLAPYAFQVYPELPAAVLLLRLFRREFYGSSDRERISDGLFLALIPLFHQKYMFLFVMSGLHLALGVFLNNRKNITNWLALIVPSAASLIFLSVFFGRRFGIWLPTAPYSVNDSLLTNLFTMQTLKIIIAQFIDRKWGLLAICPILLFLLPGIVTLGRRRPWVWFWWLATCSGFIVLLSAYPLWWGGFSPPARFLIPIVPLLWLAVSQFWQHQNSKHTGIIVLGLILLFISAFFSGLMTFGTPFEYQICSPYLYPEESPHESALWAALSINYDLNQLLPAMERNGRWNHIIPDNLRFGSKDWIKTSILILLLILWTLTALQKSKMWILCMCFCLACIYFLHSSDSDNNLITRRNYQKQLVQTSHHTDNFPLLITGAYGFDDDSWLKAPGIKYGIYFPPVYTQDMPSALWPGGYNYRFQVPVRWDPGTVEGSVVLTVENRINREKMESRISCTETEGILEVVLNVSDGKEALFKIILYGDKTASYSYKPVKILVERL